MNVYKLKTLITQIAKKYVDTMSFSIVFEADLLKLEPLTFKRKDFIELSGENLIVPKYRKFTKKDLGKPFVFISNHGGQVFYYLYEASAPGENGTEYHFQGFIEKAKLMGVCSCEKGKGKVEVKSGEIFDFVHEHGI